MALERPAHTGVQMESSPSTPEGPLGRQTEDIKAYHAFQHCYSVVKLFVYVWPL